MDAPSWGFVESEIDSVGRCLRQYAPKIYNSQYLLLSISSSKDRDAAECMTAERHRSDVSLEAFARSRLDIKRRDTEHGLTFRAVS